jgi:hypothetical protein
MSTSLIDILRGTNTPEMSGKEAEKRIMDEFERLGGGT